MLATYVKPVTTPLSFEEAATCFLAGLKSTGATISRTCHALALAKSALETGRWQHIWNDNFGNVKAGQQYAGMYTCIKLNEVLKSKVVWFAPEGELASKNGPLVSKPVPVPEGHPQTRMRAYAGHVDGVYEYIDFIAGGRYLDAWEELLQGDPTGYVMALHKAGYFTADPAVYAKTVTALYGEFLNKLGGRAAEPVPVPNPHDVREWLAPQQWNVIAAGLDAAFADRRFQIVEDNFRDDNRDMSDLPEPPKEPENVS